MMMMMMRSSLEMSKCSSSSSIGGPIFQRVGFCFDGLYKYSEQKKKKPFHRFNRFIKFIIIDSYPCCCDVSLTFNHNDDDDEKVT